MGYITVLNTHH